MQVTNAWHVAALLIINFILAYYSYKTLIWARRKFGITKFILIAISLMLSLAVLAYFLSK